MQKSAAQGNKTRGGGFSLGADSRSLRSSFFFKVLKMNKILPVFALVLAVSACGQQGSGTSPDGSSDGKDSSVKLNSDAEKRSYALGMDIGNSVKDLPLELKVDTLAAGIRDMVEGNKPKLSDDEQKAVMQSFVEDLETAQKKEASAAAEENQKKGKQFLSKNKDKEGVKVTDSGLQYKVVKEGEGDAPSAKDSVKVNYEGKLVNGDVFDSSYERGEPVTFPVSAVIPGWTEALQLMKPGAEYMLFIPPDLAYGERGAGAKIGPNETLVFKVELLEVVPAAAEEDTEEGDS